MSDMDLDAAIRFDIGAISRDEAYAKCVQMFGKEADEVEKSTGDNISGDIVDYFFFKPSENDGFTAHHIDGRLYVDFPLESLDVYDVNIDIKSDFVQGVCDKFRDKFSFSAPWKIKVLYYYSGGCAGLCEVA